MTAFARYVARRLALTVFDVTEPRDGDLGMEEVRPFRAVIVRT
jgi:hypothetical protein